MEVLYELATDYTLRTVALGAAVLGVVSGALGTFAVLRGQSLLGDAISHAALPGIAIAFILTGLKTPIVLMAGAAVAGLLCTLVVLAVVNTSRVTFDSALGLTLAVFFGFGLVLLTHIQRMPEANQAGLDTFLFGQAAALVTRDVVTMSLLGGLVLAAVLLFWKEFKLIAFDPDFGRAAGFPVRTLDVGLTTLLVLAIVIGLQTVGVVLMSAMIVAPAAAARQWTNRLAVMMLLAASIGAVSGITGAVLSSTMRNLPAGPTIVICASAAVLLSFLFAPNRGLVARAVRSRLHARRLHLDVVLLDLFEMARHHPDLSHPHDESVLDLMRGRQAPSRLSLLQLSRRGYVRRVDHRWALTEAGIRRAGFLATGETWGTGDGPGAVRTAGGEVEG